METVECLSFSLFFPSLLLKFFNMPLHIDLNAPCNDSDTIDNGASAVDLNRAPPVTDFNFNCNENRAPSIDLNYPSSSINGLFPIDLNVCPAYEEEEEEEVYENESEATLSNGDVGNIIDDFFLDEDQDMLTGTQHDPNDGGDEEGNDPLTEETIVQDGTQPSQKKRSFLDNNQRKNIAQLLLHSSYSGKLYPGTVKGVASLYSVSTDVIYRIWRQMNQTGDACHKKTKNCGRKRVAVDIEKVCEISLNKRSTLRSLACALGISKTALLKFLRDGVLRQHSNGVNPFLKDENMKARLRYCLSMLEESSIPHDPEFKTMYNVVHIDEKWFYMTKKSTNYYLLAMEDDPYRTCKNKNFIQKVMFLVAVARPRFDDEGNETFSGKIDVFPLVHKVPAKRSSVNRASGTLETKPITSITKEVSRMFLINKVLPAIKEKWPREHARETIYIQQDNAPCHVSVDDEEFCRAASEGGFDIHLTCQPPNSPDLNVLDLGFFSAIQSLQQKEATKSVDELIQAVQRSFDAFGSKDSNKIFLTLQSCMIEIMKEKGSNNYKIPHMKKDMMFNQGRLPTQLKCDWELVHEVSEYLNHVD